MCSLYGFRKKHKTCCRVCLKRSLIMLCWRCNSFCFCARLSSTGFSLCNQQMVSCCWCCCCFLSLSVCTFLSLRMWTMIKNKSFFMALTHSSQTQSRLGLQFRTSANIVLSLLWHLKSSCREKLLRMCPDFNQHCLLNNVSNERKFAWIFICLWGIFERFSICRLDFSQSFVTTQTEVKGRFVPD